jgi:predicted nucleic acid-binding Zn ribbon protein
VAVVTTEPPGTGGPGATPATRPAATPATSAARGADLARQVLAAAKADARARARGSRPGKEAPGGADAASDSTASSSGDAGAPDDDREPARRPRLPGIAAPGREWREPTSFAASISRLLAARGWQTRATDSGVLARWDVIVGPEIASHATPVSLRDGLLELEAESTAWATQLRLLAPRLLGVLRRELGDGVVTRITVRGPSAPSWRHGPVQMPGGRGPRDTYG